MRTQSTRIMLAACVLLVPVAGCVNTSASSSSLITPLTGNAIPAQPKPPPELPPAESARVCMATAEALEAGEKDVDAIVMYDRARQLDARDQERATRRIAVLYDRQGQFDKAHAEFARALQIAPHDADLLNDLGYSYYNQGLWHEAEQQLRLALSYDSKHARAWTNLGMALAQREDYDGSLAAFQKAVSPAQAYSNVAFILTAQGKREEARLSYQRALKLDPSLQLARAALARLDRPPPAPPPARTAAAPQTPARRVTDEPIYVDPQQPVSSTAPTH